MLIFIFRKRISSVLDTPFMSKTKNLESRIEINQTKRHQKKRLHKITTVLSQYYSSTVIRVSYQGFSTFEH